MHKQFLITVRISLSFAGHALTWPSVANADTPSLVSKAVSVSAIQVIHYSLQTSLGVNRGS